VRAWERERNFIDAKQPRGGTLLRIGGEEGADELCSIRIRSRRQFDRMLGQSLALRWEQQIEDHKSEGVHIGGRSGNGIMAVHLGRHIKQSAASEWGGGFEQRRLSVGRGPRALLGGLADVEVEEDGLVALVHDDVLRLDVAMDDAHLMEVGDSLEDCKRILYQKERYLFSHPDVLIPFYKLEGS